MLKVVVFVNEREVARAHLSNISDLADISDYEVQMNERECAKLGIAERGIKDEILSHKRKQTVWALVEKAATLWIRKTGERGDELTRAFLARKKAEFIAGRLPLSDPITAEEIRARKVYDENDDESD
ncbi:hypothetical protein [Ruegeria profundi]|uniref:Uncharacterized protein n=1 Tax=Ruegeria profundi TaxID=1685378 RepID=A0A0X3TS10_9RHOB|nr:hypothetical protein [Ruegeria profundi]KUJ78515.1 hypothetical protein AVO44_12425 [Ruegeria profundi]